MKLYYSPGACSLSPHIVLLEAGLKATLVKVDTKTHKTEDGGDYYAVNPKGYVPLLELDDGDRLSEGPAIIQYLADRNPASKLAPAAGTMGSAGIPGMSLSAATITRAPCRRGLRYWRSAPSPITVRVSVSRLTLGCALRGSRRFGRLDRAGVPFRRMWQTAG